MEKGGNNILIFQGEIHSRGGTFCKSWDIEISESRVQSKGDAGKKYSTSVCTPALCPLLALPTVYIQLGADQQGNPVTYSLDISLLEYRAELGSKCLECFIVRR